MVLLKGNVVLAHISFSRLIYLINCKLDRVAISVMENKRAHAVTRGGEQCTNERVQCYL